MAIGPGSTRSLRHGMRWWLHIGLWSVLASGEWIAAVGSAWEGDWFEHVLALTVAVAASTMVWWVARQRVVVTDGALRIRRFRGHETIPLVRVQAVWPGRIASECAVQAEGVPGLVQVPTQWMRRKDRTALRKMLEEAAAAPAPPALDTLAVRPGLMRTALMGALLAGSVTVGNRLSWEMMSASWATEAVLGTGVLLALVASQAGTAPARIDGDALVLGRFGRNRRVPLAAIDSVRTDPPPRGAPFVYAALIGTMLLSVAAVLLALWPRSRIRVHVEGRTWTVSTVGAPAGAAAAFATALRRRIKQEPLPEPKHPLDPAPFPPIPMQYTGLKRTATAIALAVFGLVPVAWYITEGHVPGYTFVMPVLALVAAGIVWFDPAAPRGVPGALKVGMNTVPYEQVMEVQWGQYLGQPALRVRRRSSQRVVTVPVGRRDPIPVERLYLRLEAAAAWNSGRAGPGSRDEGAPAATASMQESQGPSRASAPRSAPSPAAHDPAAALDAPDPTPFLPIPFKRKYRIASVTFAGVVWALVVVMVPAAMVWMPGSWALWILTFLMVSLSAALIVFDPIAPRGVPGALKCVRQTYPYDRIVEAWWSPRGTLAAVSLRLHGSPHLHEIDLANRDPFHRDRLLRRLAVAAAWNRGRGLEPPPATALRPSKVRLKIGVVVALLGAVLLALIGLEEAARPLWHLWSVALGAWVMLLVFLLVSWLRYKDRYAEIRGGRLHCLDHRGRMHEVPLEDIQGVEGHGLPLPLDPEAPLPPSEPARLVERGPGLHVVLRDGRRIRLRTHLVPAAAVAMFARTLREAVDPAPGATQEVRDSGPRRPDGVADRRMDR